MTAEPDPKPENSTEGKRRRLTLMESYDPELSAFSTSKLSEISDAIRTISAPNQDRLPHSESHDESHDETPSDSHGQIHNETSSESHDEPHDESPGIPSDQIVRPLSTSPSHSSPGELTNTPGISPGYTSSESSNGSLDISPGVTLNHSSRGESHDEIVILTSNQALLYECTKILNGRFTTLARVSQVVNISVDTLRSCLRKLRKIGVVEWSIENISGQNGMRISASFIPYTVRGSRTALDDKLANLDHAKLALNSNPNRDYHQVSHQMDNQANHQVPHQVDNQMKGQVSHQVDHQANHQVFHQISYSSSSFKNKTLLQELEISLMLEGHLENLDVRSLAPYLGSFDSVESVQLFLDMVNASIDAAADSAKPIQNPKGFLIAQLRAGYINPPPGFKSRRVLAQEAMNAQLQAELAELQRLREQEAELRFELFKVGLSDEQCAELEAETAKRVKPNGPVSRERQLEVYRDEVLREWFEQRS